MEVLLRRALGKISAETSRKHRLIRAACAEVLEALDEDAAAAASPDATPIRRSRRYHNTHFEPLKLACESGNSKLTVTALDTLAKLCAHGYFRDVIVSGTVPAAEAAEASAGAVDGSRSRSSSGSIPPATPPGPAPVPKTFADVIVETVCKCDLDTEQVQLQVIKALLTVVTCSSLEVHEASLLQAVRTIYTVHLSSHSAVNKMTAKASLQQLLSYVFTRMEQCDKRQQDAAAAAFYAAENPAAAASSEESAEHSNGDAATADTAEQIGEVPGTPQKQGATEQADAGAAAAAASEEQAAALAAAAADAAESMQCPESMYEAVFMQQRFDTLYTLAAAAAAAGDDQGTAADSSSVDSEAEEQEDDTDPHERLEHRCGAFPSLLHRDAFLLFRALCKLSMKADGADDSSSGGGAGSSGAGSGSPGAADSAATEARQFESKTLSLELLLSVMEHSGPAFRTADKFIMAVTNYLCVSVLKNCTSANTVVVGLSLRIFVLLSQYFKEHLKSEIEVFITSIFLRILESGNSTYDHKKLVLDVVCTICASPHTLAEIFLNYDCDGGAIDLYKRIVNALAKVAIGRGAAATAEAHTPTLLLEESHLRSAGLEGLVNILVSMLTSISVDGESGVSSINGSIGGAGSSSSKKSSSGSSGTAARRSVASQSQQLLADSEADLAAVNDSAAGGYANGSHAADEQSQLQQQLQQQQQQQQGSANATLVHEYDRKKKLEAELANGFIRFNLSPAKGLLFLEGKGLLEHTPAGVAAFLHAYADKLDKSAIGEYLGKEKEYKGGFCIKVLHEYADQMHFSGMSFDDAIRHYLSGFRLPGEAQKIDRMMEKFAERYCLQNPAVFPSADTAFILAFSVIMLNTDLHNPAIREDRRMTKAGFIGNNRGIAAGGNLDEGFLSEIFDRIKAEPISLKEDDVWRAKLKVAGGAGESALSPFYATFTGVSAADKLKKEAFDKERADMARAGEVLFKRRKRLSAVNATTAATAAATPATPTSAASGISATEQNGTDPTAAALGTALTTNTVSTTAAGAPAGTAASAAAVTLQSMSEADAGQYVRAMFEVAWWPMLGAFSQILEECGGRSAYDGASPGASPAPVAPGSSAAIAEAQAALEREMVRLCLTGCRYGLRLGALCAVRGGSEEAKVARETFINGLAKFTLLDKVTEMGPKNVECVKTLLAIAIEDGDYLAESWGTILRYISQLARLLLFAGNLHQDDVFFASDDVSASTDASTASSSSSGGSGSSLRRASTDLTGWVGRGVKGGASLFMRGVTPSDVARDVERHNAELVTSMVEQSAVDRVFSSSCNLSTAGIRHMVVQLCAVSRQEIDHTRQATFRAKDVLSDMSAPRIFSLQKLVEVADFNMDSRGRIVWADIWGVLSAHFAAIGSHDNTQVAMYAIDSLRQLAHKFMAKEELRDFNFQRLFMRPFETVAAQSRRAEIREFVLRCVDNLVQARRPSIRSGWKSIFAVLATAARDTDPSITQLAWSMLDNLITQHMDSLSYDFLDLTKCLLAFVEAPRVDLALAAIAHLEVCGDKLALAATATTAATAAAGDSSSTDVAAVMIVPPVVHPHLTAARSTSSSGGSASTAPAAAAAADVGAGSEGGSIVHLQLWWPLLYGLSENVTGGAEVARHGCLEALCRVLKAHGHLFSTQTWGLLLKGVLAPMMEGAATDAEAQNSSSSSPLDDGESLLAAHSGWVAVTAPRVLRVCVELFFLHGDTTRPLLPEMLALIQSCVCQEAEALARTGLAVLGEFIDELEEREASAVTHSSSSTAEQQRVIVRPAAAGAGAGDTFTVWDCLTASLTAMLLDNLPVEVLEGSGSSAVVTATAAPAAAAATTTAAGAAAAPTADTAAAAVAVHKSVRQLSAADLSPQLSPVVKQQNGATTGTAAAAVAAATDDDTESTFDAGPEEEQEEDYRQQQQQQQHDLRGEPNLNALMTMLVVGLRLLPMLQSLVFKHGGSSSSSSSGAEHLSDGNLTTIIEAFEASGAACRRFNNSFSVRRTLGRVGFMTPGRQPAPVCQFLQQEMASYAALLQSLAHLSSSDTAATAAGSDSSITTGSNAGWSAAPLRLGRLCRTVVMGYCARERALKDLLSATTAAATATAAETGSDAALMQEAIDAMTPLVIEALRAMRRLSDQQLTSGKEWVYQTLVGLITCDSAEVRGEVHRIFATKMTTAAGWQ